MHKYTNQLIHESSPYLLQHAHNPVEWYAWGDAAFEKAVKEDKPILVSIGYAACHWCHVMEKESFENEQTAAFMNTYFVNIKVDREERPDVDHIYMQACQLISGAGGWPLNMFLTPEKKPFTGGTYFPPKPYYGKPSWLDVLVYVMETFQKERDKVEKQADMLVEYIQKSGSIQADIKILPAGDGLFSTADVQTVSTALLSQADETEGGFGSAPKFPSAMALLYMLRKNFYITGDKELQHLHTSLHNMMYGGIYDHVGGGFARYSVDRYWKVPHFEKMLYDNALLGHLYAEAASMLSVPAYKRITTETLDFILREMCSDEGGFYSSFDADSEGGEGIYYTWQKQEIEKLLGDDAAFFCAAFQVEENGNWEHTNILHRKTELPPNDALMQAGEIHQKRIANCLATLFKHRQKRPAPALDDKIITGWNALMSSALIAGYKATGNRLYRDAAEKNVQFMLHKCMRGHNNYALYHSYKNGTAKHVAVLDDYSSLITALLDVYQVTGTITYVEHAIEMNRYVGEHFSDKEEIFYFFTEANQTDIPLRSMELYDHATPSGNAMQCINLQKLAVITGDASLTNRAEKMLHVMKKNLFKIPVSYGQWLCGALNYAYPCIETAICGKDAKQLLHAINTGHYYPNQIIMTDDTGDMKNYPLVQNRFHALVTRIYNCRNYECHIPVKNLEEYKAQIQAFLSGK
jgi:hypothetical protein